MGIFKRGDSEFWYARIRVNGRTHRRSLGTTSRAEAESMCRKITDGKPVVRKPRATRRRIARSTFDSALNGAERPRDVAGLLRAWSEWLRNHSHMKRGSVDSYMVSVRRFDEMWGHLEPHELSSERVADWAAERVASGAANSTLKSERQVLRVFMRWCRDRGLGFTTSAPVIPRTGGVSKKVPRPLSSAELEKLFAEVRRSPRAQVRALEPLLMVGLHAGLRREESRFLTWADIDWDGNVLRVTSKPEVGFTIKDHEEREVPMSEALRAYLERSRDDAELLHGATADDRVCVNDRHEPWSLGVSRWLRELFDAAGVGTRWGTSHRLRHSFATTLLRGGVDLATLRDLMGHSNIEVTSRYLAATPERQSAVAALDGLPGPQTRAPAPEPM